MIKIRHVAQCIGAVIILVGVNPAVASSYDAALKVYQSGDFAGAIKMLQPLLAAGDPDAESLMAEIYWFGQGVPINLSTAAKLAAEAAAKGNAEGEMLLGDAYVEGRGVPQNSIKGYSLLQGAAAKHNSRAELALSLAFFKNTGPVQDQATAVELLKEAADSGLYEAQFLYGSFLQTGEYGVPKDLVGSIRFTTMAADQRYAPAELALARDYFNVPGFRHDRVLAAAWAMIAAKADCAVATHVLEPLLTLLLSPQDKGKAQAMADEWEKRHPPHHSLDVDLNTRMICDRYMPRFGA